MSEEVGVLFSPNDLANSLYPPQKVLDEVLARIMTRHWPGFGARTKPSAGSTSISRPRRCGRRHGRTAGPPRNSYELAFRNQFFTPRYVVEFRTDNTLGRIWFEMRKGDTKLRDQCRSMLRRPSEVFLDEGALPPKGDGQPKDDLSQQELLNLPVYVPPNGETDSHGMGSFGMGLFGATKTTPPVE